MTKEEAAEILTRKSDRRVGTSHHSAKRIAARTKTNAGQPYSTEAVHKVLNFALIIRSGRKPFGRLERPLVDEVLRVLRAQG